MTTGSKLGPYEIIGKIGAGGMGEVYRARDTRLGRDVAIKVLPASFAGDADRLRRFEQEARATGMLNHPNILAVYDVGTHDGAPYLVTELLEGQTLREELPTPRRKALDYARQVTAGLAAAHSKGITHRDLKPDNLFITSDGRVKILDFGLAKLEIPETDGGATLSGATTPGIALGTVGYMSPEQARGKPADHRSDIFSFGAILYEMLSGHRAFHRDSTMDTMSAILKEDPPPLSDAALEAVVRRCLEKSPDQRFQSASDLGFAIEAMSGSVMIPAVSGAVAAVPETVIKAKPMWSAVAIAALVALAIGALGGAWWQARQAASAPHWQGERITGMGIVYAPRISPDGKTLAIVVVEGIQSQLAVMHPGSANWTVLTHESGRGEIGDVCWSRDGTKIYFGRRTTVYSIPALGGEERVVLEQAQGAEVLPDGSMLFVRRNADQLNQLHRVWPDSGRIEALNIEALPRIRVFPDGKEAIFIGRPLPVAPGSDYELIVLDLATSKVRYLAKNVALGSPTVGIPPDGKSIVAVVKSGELLEFSEIARDGSGKPRVLFTSNAPPWFVDVAADGAIYMDHIERPFDILRFPLAGGIPELVVEAARGGFAVPLADGRVAFEANVANRDTILISQPGKNPVPLVETEEETSGPIARIGNDSIAIKMGKPGGGYKSRVVTIVSLADGRIARRIEQTRGLGMTVMAASPDGKTLYYTAENVLWSVAVDGGQPKKLGFGICVAVNPNGKDLVVTRQENKILLYRIPLDGGAESEIAMKTDLVLNPSLAGNAIRADGKIAITVLQPNSWWDETGILDPVSGKVERLNVPYSGDSFAPAWTPDGRLLAQGQPIQGSIWRFKK